MNIVVLNECFFSANHIARLKKLGKVTIFENTTSEKEVMERSKGADIVIADMYVAPLSAQVIAQLKSVKLLAINSTGFDLVDLPTAKKQGIAVSNVPGFGTISVAELAIGLVFAVNRHIPLGDREVRNLGFFDSDPGNQAHKKYLGMNLNGKTLGIIGFGAIGKHIADLGNGIGMQVIAYNRTSKKEANVKFMPLNDVLKNSDVVILSLALNKETQNMIGKKQLQLMKKSAILINIARGKLVDTDALYDALSKKQIRGAGVDTVTAVDQKHSLLQLDNVVFVPHIGWYTQESLLNIANIIVENVESFVKKKSKNIIKF